MQTKDGGKIFVAVNAVPLSRDGQVTGVQSIIHDITERMRDEAEIQDELRKLAQAVEQSPESIVITNLDAEIEYVNNAFVNRTWSSRISTSALSSITSNHY